MIETLLIYILCDVCKHLEDIVEVALILFYSQTYLCVAVSEQIFGVLAWENTRSWSISTTALPELYRPLLYISCDVCKHLEDTIEVALISIYSQSYLCVAVSERVFNT